MADTTQSRWSPSHTRSLRCSDCWPSRCSVAVGEIWMACVAQGLRGTDRCGGRSGGACGDAPLVCHQPDLPLAIPVRHTLAAGADRCRGFAVQLAWVEMKRVGKQKAAVERIRMLNAWIWYDYEPENGNPFATVEPPYPALLRSLLGDDFFADVAGVSISDDFEITHADFELLRQFTRLQELALPSSCTTDATLVQIKTLIELR